MDVAKINGYDIKDTVAREGVNTLDSQMELLYENKPYYILVGDSYGNDTTRDGEFVTGWVTRFKEIYGLTQGVNVWHMIEGQAGWVNPGTQDHNFEDMLELLLASMTEEQKAKVGHVVMCGGSNDSRYAPDGDYTAALTRLNNIIINNIPNAKCFVIPIGMTNETRGRRRAIPVTYSKIQEACTGFPNICYIHGAWYPLYYNPNMCSDNVHMNNNGTIAVLKNIINGLNGTNAHYFKRSTLYITLDSTRFSNAIDNMEVQMSDNMLYFQSAMMNAFINFITGESWRMDGKEKEIGTYTCDLLLPLSNFRVDITGRVRNQAERGKYYEYAGYLHFKEGVLYICTTTTADTSDFPTITANRIGIDLNGFVKAIENV